VTKEKTNFYDENNTLIYSLPKSFDLPVIINYGTSFGVEFNDRLLFIKSEDVETTRDNSNTSVNNTSGIAVLNYHFFYDSTNSDEVKDCNQILCVSIDSFRKHLDYIKNNNFFTPTMREFEQYVDGSIKLPKSVLITIDDGWRSEQGIKAITEYGLNATLFLMTKYYDPASFKTEYVEVHSHGHDLHNAGVCPGGQGGGIKCLNKEVLLDDLRNTREKLNNTTYFCYPFYEYNNYSIEVLKEAGFTMAFAGYKEGGHPKAYPGIDKFRIPRYPIYDSTTLDEFIDMIN
jgi:peptidoglycan/xylan/chitin deacetylase (PgdA/CDA1 family)